MLHAQYRRVADFVCVYLAGRPYSSKPLQNVSVFQGMRDRLNKLMTEHVLHL